MTEKRYFKREWEEEYYIFDSETISEKEFDEKVEYEDYQAFVDSMQGNEVVDRLNALHEEKEQLKQELQKIQDSFELNWTQNRVEFDKDKLYIKDTNTETCLDNRNLSIRVRIPSLNEYYLFKYEVTGRSLMKEFVEKYNSKGDE